ncbi:MAG TPA: hypothetical protein VJ972_14355 [Anaerolineales bacterium]|nr:hypothetical protein [Anaerolineales bacterium]
MLVNKKLVVLLVVAVLIITACGPSAPSTNADGSINVDVTLTDFTMESSVTTFEAGKTYRFTITNEGLVPHEFVIAEPLMEGETHGAEDAHSDEGMEMMHEGLVIEVEDEELQPGATVTVDATFPDHVDGELEFACHIEGHYEAGMRSPISIKE